MAGVPLVKFERSSSPTLTLENVRNILGNHVNEALMLQSLSESNNKIHWCVNSYFRAVYLNTTHQNRIISTQHSDVRPHGVSNLSVFTISKLPSDIQTKILMFLDYTSLVQVSSTSKLFRRSLCSDFADDHNRSSHVWLNLLISYAYILPVKNTLNTSKIPVVVMPDKLLMVAGMRGSDSPATVAFRGQSYHSMIPSSNNDTARDLFQKCFQLEKSRSCLRCGAVGTITPVVYGYPSASLVFLHSVDVISMGGDYLFEGAASWRCRTCKGEFYAYPYRCCWMQIQK